jgi:hypothetical protein
LGAAAGCAVGSHVRNKAEKRAAQHAQHDTQINAPNNSKE